MNDSNDRSNYEVCRCVLGDLIGTISRISAAARGDDEICIRGTHPTNKNPIQRKVLYEVPKR